MSILEIGGLLLVLFVVVSAARGKVRINARETSDFEARLRPVSGAPAGARASGAAEREEWDDGSPSSRRTCAGSTCRTVPRSSSWSTA